MGRICTGLVVTAAVLLGLAGCHKNNEYLQPPKPKEEFTQPPADDPRFTGPPNYPAKLLNEDTMRRDAEEDAAGAKGGGLHGQGAAGTPYDH